MRLFVAIDVPGAVKEKAAALATELQSDAIMPVRPQNMHVTMKFMGEVDGKELPEISERLGKIRFQPFSCSVKSVGVFPDEEHVRVVWAGAQSDGALERLADDVIAALKGYGKEEKFTAHLTIARVKKKIDARPFLAKHKDELFGEFDVSSFRLISSELGPTGSKYTVIKEFSAGK
jgi:RNA 2',3'-cyclic 3'-phosphodiesterase